jgi:alpha-maltose-1-phosphate synthase
MKALVVHPGTQHSFQLVRQLQRHGSLSRFWTGFGYIPDSKLGRFVECLPTRFQRRLSNRRLDGVPNENLRTRPLTELRAQLRLRAGHDSQTVMLERNAAFQRDIPSEDIASSDVVIGYDTASWRLAERALEMGRRFILVQTTAGYPPSVNRLFLDLRRQFPEWADDFPTRLRQLSVGEESEQQRAHRIVVASSFPREKLIENGIPGEKIVINPLGVNLGEFLPMPRPDSSRPLRFLFLGSLIAAKGVPLLLQAWRSLANRSAELWLAGTVSKRHARLIPSLPGLRVVGKVPHRELAGLLRKCDVLVLPSYFEGFGLVLLEALAAGLAVIATEATAARDLMTNGVEGYIVPTGDAQALQDAMQRFLASPGDLATMSLAARRCAERYSWDAYGDRWIEILRQSYDTCSTNGTSDRIPYAVSATTGPSRVARTNGAVKALLVHPGTQYSFKLAGQLQLHGCLTRFWTGMAYVPGSSLGRAVECLPKRIQRQLANRSLDDVPAENLRTRPFGEWRALRRLRAGHDDQSVMYERNAAFQNKIPRQEIADSHVVIGFDTSSWLLAERALALGRKFILDRSIGHPLHFERVLQTLRHRFPEWVDDSPPRLPELLRAEEEEHRKADRIVVPSSFVRGTLIEQGISAAKIAVIPFGVDLDVFRPRPRPDASRPLRFVFLGSIGARKGVPLLLQAWRSLAPTNAELWLVGSISQRHARLIPSLPGLRLFSRVPHRELPDLLSLCDVLVFPSYFEGLAQVQLEGMAAGLPIIGTEASGAPDLIADGKEGYLIPVGDAEALRCVMRRFIDSPGDLARMSPAARLAAERYSWGAYGNRWMDLLRQVV